MRKQALHFPLCMYVLGIIYFLLFYILPLMIIVVDSVLGLHSKYVSYKIDSIIVTFKVIVIFLYTSELWSFSQIDRIFL